MKTAEFRFRRKDLRLCNFLSEYREIVKAFLFYPMKIQRGDKNDFVKAWQKFLGLPADGDFGVDTEKATKTFQRANALKADGIVGAATIAAAEAKGFKAPIDANNVIVDTLLPMNGEGYTTYNRERNGADQYGTAFTIGAIVELAAKWAELSTVPIQVGDISRQGGGAFPPHASHRNGRDFDVRPFRKDKKLLPVDCRTISEYNADLTAEFVRMVRNYYPNAIIYFNDSVLIKKGLVRFMAGHYNHLHFRLK